MSKRVYEIAREQSLDSKEVIQRLKEAGVDVKSHSSSVEENVYQRVFGAETNGETPNGRTEAQEAEAREARAEAERSGHGATIAEAPAEEPVSVPQQGRPQKRRRRVVIDASARNRGARPTASTAPAQREPEPAPAPADRKSTRLNSSHCPISYAVFCLKKKKKSTTLTSLCKKKKTTNNR